MLGCIKDWCLMCELEQHVAMLTESGGPLSPSRFLSQMRSINRHIGHGSQEDAHEFLRSTNIMYFPVLLFCMRLLNFTRTMGMYIVVYTLGFQQLLMTFADYHDYR